MSTTTKSVLKWHRPEDKLPVLKETGPNTQAISDLVLIYYRELNSFQITNFRGLNPKYGWRNYLKPDLWAYLDPPSTL